MFVISSEEKLELNQVINNGCVSNTNGEWDTLTFKVIGIATRQDYIKMCKDNNWSYDIGSLNPNFYFIHCD